MTDEINTPTEEVEDPMEGMEKSEPVYNNLKWGKIGDYFKGTLTENTRTMPNAQKPGSTQRVFEFKALIGSFHDIKDKIVDADPTVCIKDDFWSLITDKEAIVSQLKNVQLGTIIGLRFVETKKASNPMHSDAKIINVFIGGVDPEYSGETAADTA